MYILVDDIGVPRETTERDFYRSTVHVEPAIGTRLTAQRLLTFKFIVVCMLLACSPLVIFASGVSRLDDFVTEKEAKDTCHKPNVESVTINRRSTTKVIDC